MQHCVQHLLGAYARLRLALRLRLLDLKILAGFPMQRCAPAQHSANQKWLFNYADPVILLKHETVHALKSMGLFTTSECRAAGH